MKKKLLIASVAILFLMIGIMGTVAYFTASFGSDGNTANAATFDVEAINKDGQTIGDAQFKLDDDLYPGMDILEVYYFDINKNNTELPMEYSVDLNPSGALFPAAGNTPLDLKLQRYVDGEWVNINFTNTFTPEFDTESFRVLVDWPHGDNDIQFQGKTGNIHLEVVATQVDEVVEEGPPYFTDEVIFKATSNGYTRRTENKEISFSTNDDGTRVVEVLMGDTNPDGDFESKVGNLKIVEYSDDRGDWIRVYSDHEYFASDTQMWRIRQNEVDLSVEGEFSLRKSNGPYLTIQSQALYNFFKN